MTESTEGAFCLRAAADDGVHPVLAGVKAQGRLDGLLFSLTLRQTYRNTSSRTLEVVEGPAVDEDRASVSHAFAGIAESGTIVQISGAADPTTLNFVPEAHIVVLEASDLFASYEEAWSKLRGLMGEGNMPRTVNMISGPSRTADIEQTIVRPAHGPKNMHVIIVR